MKCTRIGGKRCNCSCFEIDQEMDTILLIIGIVYRVCLSVNLLLVGVNYGSLQLISDKIQIIRFYLSLLRSDAYVESEVKLFACKEINGEKWYDKLFNVKYLPLFHHFKAIYQFPKHIIVLVKIVANAALKAYCLPQS